MWSLEPNCEATVCDMIDLIIDGNQTYSAGGSASIFFFMSTISF